MNQVDGNIFKTTEWVNINTCVGNVASATPRAMVLVCKINHHGTTQMQTKWAWWWWMWQCHFKRHWQHDPLALQAHPLEQPPVLNHRWHPNHAAISA
jgi:hypothetical protein